MDSCVGLIVCSDVHPLLVTSAILNITSAIFLIIVFTAISLITVAIDFAW